MSHLSESHAIENRNFMPMALCYARTRCCSSLFRPAGNEQCQYAHCRYVENNAVCQNSRRKMVLRVCHSKAGRRHHPAANLLRCLSESNTSGEIPPVCLFPIRSGNSLQAQRYRLVSKPVGQHTARYVPFNVSFPQPPILTGRFGVLV